MPLTPALRAAKAAREQALQRAPLTRRSEAILYQVRQVYYALNLHRACE